MARIAKDIQESIRKLINTQVRHGIRDNRETVTRTMPLSDDQVEFLGENQKRVYDGRPLLNFMDGVVYLMFGNMQARLIQVQMVYTESNDLLTITTTTEAQVKLPRIQEDTKKSVRKLINTQVRHGIRIGKESVTGTMTLSDDKEAAFVGPYQQRVYTGGLLSTLMDKAVIFSYRKTKAQLIQVRMKYTKTTRSLEITTITG